MLIKDILCETAKMLGKSEDEAVTEQEERRLLTGLGFVIDELARTRFPLVKTERVPLDGGKVRYSDFSRIPIRIYKAEYDGKAIDFTVQSDGLKIQSIAPDVEITYAYEPLKPTKDGETEWRESVPLRILAYGTATEYCLMHGLAEDAAMWDKRYRDALDDIANLSANGRKIRARRWTP